MTELSLAERLTAARDGLTVEEASVAQAYVERLHLAGILSTAQLVETVSDPRGDPDVRDMACRLVGWLRVSEAAAALVRAFDKTDDDGFVWVVANSLVRLRPAEVTTNLLELLQRGTPTKQAAAAWVLGWLGEKSAVPLLAVVAMDPLRDVDIRGHAVEALGVLQAQEAVPDLMRLISSELPDLRYWAAYSLGQIADSVAIPALEQAVSIETAVLPPDRSVRQEMLDALAAIRTRQPGGEK